MVEPEQKRRSAHPTEALSSDDGARRLVGEIKAGWSKGEPADAVRALDQHQQLRERKSFVLDLAYEEYCRRTDEGEMVEREAFIERFPTHARSLARLLDVHDYLSQAGTLTGLSPAKWPQIGDRFLGFEVVEELGRGAFARVYRATELALGNRPVVLKVARQGAGEADTLGRLRHRNVVPVHAVLEDPDSGLTAIVMPYLGSRTLCEFLDEAAAKPSQRYVENVLAIGSKLCDALEFTHSNGVLHRDLKPSNILLSADEEPMLLDFNLAVRLDQETARAGGTLPYMAPEQLESIHRKSTTVVDSRADIFGLGVVLYEMLTGELPFHPKEPSSAAAQWECRRDRKSVV